ncbi:MULTISPECIES: helix-turn-helix transcriptional regulator [Vibrio harveyi group]|uniref:helix-turn-helix transcriptional regulator n=2 Tax=Vibrio TaxID=662 RepID=UPI001BD62BB7|nr:hypothetical protein [Vibrio alginolyticus]MBT0017426.1 hypothetical protein [Vibrio alginolyticus]
MSIYEFTLNIGNINITNDNDLLDVSRKLYEGACSDAVVMSVDEMLYIEFEREAVTFVQAVTQAIKDVESVEGYDLQVISIEGDLVSLGEAAEFTGVKKSTLAKYKKGTFGGGGFPVPVRKASKKDPLWRLSDIADWLYKKNKVAMELVERARLMDVINHHLETRLMKNSDKYANLFINIQTNLIIPIKS